MRIGRRAPGVNRGAERGRLLRAGRRRPRLLPRSPISRNSGGSWRETLASVVLFLSSVPFGGFWGLYKRPLLLSIRNAAYFLTRSNNHGQLIKLATELQEPVPAPLSDTRQPAEKFILRSGVG